MSSLKEVCRDGNLEELRKLLNRGDIAQSAFYWVCEYGQLKVAKWLLKIEPSIDMHAHSLSCR
jgi:hypothetical protein